MAIKNKLVHFKTYNEFKRNLDAGNILNESIVFIKDQQRIWTHGTFYSSLKEVTDALKSNESKIDSAIKVVYSNHIYTNVSVSPNIGFKGENTPVTLTFYSGINGSSGLTPTYTVKKNGTVVNLVSGAKESLSQYTDYEVTGSLGGVSRSGHAYFNAYYPIYTFTATTNTVTAIPDNATKQAVANTPAGRTYSYNNIPGGSYLYIAVPDGMSVNGGSSGGYDAGFTSAGTINVTGKGTYKIYRTGNAQDPGNYSILFR